MAARLGVSRMTVMRAYRELQKLGLVDVRYGDGVFASLSNGQKGDPPDVAQIDAWAATLGLKVNPWAVALTIEATRGEVRPSPRRITRRERAWLGQRMRALVRDARRFGLSANDLDALLRSAIEWENLSWSCEKQGKQDFMTIVEAISAPLRRRRGRASTGRSRTELELRRSTQYN